VGTKPSILWYPGSSDITRGLLSKEGKNYCDAVLNEFEKNTIYIHRMQLRLAIALPTYADLE
jgi:hypothetical protein